MIRLSEKSRRILRALYSGLGAAALSMTVNSCGQLYIEEASAYGMPPPRVREEIKICGEVRAKKTGEPVRNIAVYIKETNSIVTTSYGGIFYIYASKRDSYTVIFTDIDAEENGGRFKQQIITLTKKEAEALAENPLIIELEPEETDEE